MAVGMKKLKYIPITLGLAFSNLAYSHQCLKVYDYKAYIQQLSLADAKQQYAVDLDESNFGYFKMLLKLYYGKAANNREIRLFDPANPVSDPNKQTVYLVANAPKEQLKYIHLTNYDSLLEQQAELSQIAKQITLNLNFMQAGIGTSVDRVSFLSERLGIPEEKVKNGAKATGLYLPGSNMSIAEALIHQGIAKSADYAGINYTDLVSNETDASINKAWQNVKADGRDLKKLKHGKKVTQYQIPTINSENKLSTNRLAPGGHGLFAFNMIERLLSKSPSETKNQISVISNGEDLSGSPDPVIVGYMKKHNIPIMMVTTEKTEIDLKGGQIGIAKGQTQDGRSYYYPTIVEQAQAEKAGQKSLFEKMGLVINGESVGERKSLFNTNMVIINEEVLAPLLRAEVQRTGIEALLNEISPALIRTDKEQTDSDGVKRTYTQLEGAMGSIMLKLDQHFRNTTGTPLITFMNIERQHRTKFFAPIKTAFDYWMLFYSDRFQLQKESFTLKDNVPGLLPSIKLQDPETKDKYYANVKNILESFDKTSILRLEELTVSGKVNLSGLTLKGKVQIINETGSLVTSELIGKMFPPKKELKNVKIIFEKSGLITIEKI